MLESDYASFSQVKRGAPKGDYQMRANQVRTLLLTAVVGTAVTLAGCGGRSVSSVDENDSTISSVASTISENTMSADTLSGNGVIAAQEIDPSAVVPSVSGDSVSSNGTDGSVSSDSSDTESTTEESTGYTTAGVNMRSDADADSDVVNTIEYGEKVTVLGTKDGWTHVRYDGDEGYVKSTYISSTEPSGDDSSDDDDDEDEEYTSDDSDRSDRNSDDEDSDESEKDNSEENEDTESSSDD